MFWLFFSLDVLCKGTDDKLFEIFECSSISDKNKKLKLKPSEQRRKNEV